MAIGKTSPTPPPSSGRFYSFFGGRDILRRLLISVLVGVVSGLGALAFFLALEWRPGCAWAIWPARRPPPRLESAWCTWR